LRLRREQQEKHRWDEESGITSLFLVLLAEGEKPFVIERSWRSNWLWVSFWGALLVHNYYNNANNNNSPTTTKREARGVL
jgi:hypothetical protein